jgi:hypothetical protein
MNEEAFIFARDSVMALKSIADSLERIAKVLEKLRSTVEDVTEEDAIRVTRV